MELQHDYADGCGCDGCVETHEELCQWADARRAADLAWRLEHETEEEPARAVLRARAQHVPAVEVGL